MEKRKTVTFSRDIFDALKRLKDPERLEIYDKLFTHFFEGKPIEYNKIESDVVQAVLSCLTPNLRKLQTKFENGSCKKSSENSSLFICEQSGSELKRTEASASESDSSDYIINLIYKYIDTIKSINHNIIINNIIYNNKQSITKNLKSLKSDNQATMIKVMSNIIKNNQIKVAGEPKNSAEVLDTVMVLLLDASGTSQVNQKINEIKSLDSIRNPLSYITVALYNLARSQNQPKSNLKSVTRANSGIISHNYTKEQLQNVYDDLDSVEI